MLVTRFAVDREYLSAFDMHPAGGGSYTEYWIPAEVLGAFNDHIHGLIDVMPNLTTFFPNHSRLIHPAGAAGFNDASLQGLSNLFMNTEVP